MQPVLESFVGGVVFFCVGIVLAAEEAEVGDVSQAALA
jgi:hypothetical protein